MLHFGGFYIEPWLPPPPSSMDSHPHAPFPLHLIPLIKATASQGCSTSSPKSHSPHFPTAPSSQWLLSSCTRREFCLFSHPCNMGRRARLTHRHQNGLSTESGSLGYTSCLPHRTGSWACGFSLTETGSHKKSQWNNLQGHYQYQLFAVRLIWSTTSQQKSSLDRNKQSAFPSCPLSCPSSNCRLSSSTAMSSA